MKLKRNFMSPFSFVISLVLLVASAQVETGLAASPQTQRQVASRAQQSHEVVPAEFIGDWVPASGTCASPARFRAEGNRFTLINGQDSASYGDSHMATSEA